MTMTLKNQRREEGRSLMQGRLIIASVSLPLLLSSCGLTSGNNSRNISVSTSGSSTPISVNKQVPAIGDKSTVRDTTAYINYYKGQGYAIMTNQQAFNADGTVKSFSFFASRKQGSNMLTATARIDSAHKGVTLTEKSNLAGLP